MNIKNVLHKYELQQFVMLCHVTGVFSFTELTFDFFSAFFQWFVSPLYHL